MGIFTCNHCHMTFEAEPPPEGPLRCPHCNGTVTAPDFEAELPPGFSLGGFEIIRLLGRGGMGNVYLATQLSMQRNVALKVLPKSITRDTGAVVKFLNEVNNSGRLQHPHIVTAIDAGEDNGTYFLAMQYVEGETLEAIIEKRRRIPEGEALDLSLMVAEALKYSWDRHGIFHKDIKPGNIMVDSSSGDAFLLDMGISQKIGDQADPDGHVEGSPFYMSPEQTRGEKLDWTTDLYSLGATLYNALVGVPPFDDKNLMRIVEMHTTDPFPEPSRRNPEAKLSPPVVSLLKKMMEKTPSARFKSWAAFMKEAEKVMNELGKKPRPRMVLSKAKPGKGRGASHKKSSVPYLTLINLVLILALGSGVTYYAVTSINKSAARKALESAEKYIMKPGFNYEEAVKAFSMAKEASERFGVEEAVKSRAAEGYSNVKIVAARQAKAAAAFESAFKKAAELYSNTKDLYAMAKSAYAEKRNDDGLFLKCSGKIKETLKALSEIPTDNPKEKEQIEQVSQSLVLMGKQIEADIKRMGLQDSGAPKESPAKKFEEERRKQKEEAVGSYKKSLAKREADLTLLFMVSCRKRDFETPRKSLSNVSESTSPNAEVPEFKPLAVAFDAWASSMLSHLDRAQKAWGSLFNSGKKLSARSFDCNGRQQTVFSIEDDVIAYDDDRERISISELSSASMADLMKKALPDGAGSLDLFSFLMANGDFSEAAKIAPDSEASQTLSKAAKVYLKARLKKALSDKDAGRGSGGIEKLKKEYGSLPEYQEVEKELNP